MLRLTFRWVIRKGNVEEFSCVPYILALLNCLLYTWYGLPVVSSGWENLPVATINGLGILLEVAFIAIYLRFAPAEKKASPSPRPRDQLAIAYAGCLSHSMNL